MLPSGTKGRREGGEGGKRGREKWEGVEERKKMRRVEGGDRGRRGKEREGERKGGGFL